MSGAGRGSTLAVQMWDTFFDPSPKERLLNTMPTPDPRAILIAIEGIDGAGKTTQVNILRDAFQRVREPLLVSKEPTDGPWGRKIRESAATGRMPVDQELAAFIADRTEHVREKIAPALASGQIVILDRYFYSSIAYQGCRGAEVAEIEAEMTRRFPVPDAVFVLDLAPEVSLFRIHHWRKDTPNEFEQLEGLAKARRIFQQLRGDHIHLIDGSVSPAAVHASIIDLLVEGPLKSKRCAKAYGCDDQWHCSYRITGTCEWFRLQQALRAASGEMATP
jgi:dTMP kinase